MQLRWPEWGETDFGLTQAYDWFVHSRCPCGCGQSREDCTDPAKADRWQVTLETAYAGAAIEDFQREHTNDKGESDLPSGALLGVYLLAEGEIPTDPLEDYPAFQFDPERAAAEYAAHQKRFGLA